MDNFSAETLGEMYTIVKLEGDDEILQRCTRKMPPEVSGGLGPMMEGWSLMR
jgi:hypothetical protein